MMILNNMHVLLSIQFAELKLGTSISPQDFKEHCAGPNAHLPVMVMHRHLAEPGGEKVFVRLGFARLCKPLRTAAYLHVCRLQSR